MNTSIKVLITVDKRINDTGFFGTESENFEDGNYPTSPVYEYREYKRPVSLKELAHVAKFIEEELSRIGIKLLNVHLWTGF